MFNSIAILLSLVLFYATPEIHNENKIYDKCLLIKYYEGTSNEVIKYYGLFKNKDKFFFHLDYYGDDFSEFYPSDRTFFIDGDWNNNGSYKTADSTKILFWDYSVKNEISTLPYKYSSITIDSLINNSTILISLNNTKHILASGQIFTDSITVLKNENRRLIKHKTVYHIENLGLIYKKNILDQKAIEERQRADEEERENNEFRELNLK